MKTANWSATFQKNSTLSLHTQPKRAAIFISTHLTSAEGTCLKGYRLDVHDYLRNFLPHDYQLVRCGVELLVLHAATTSRNANKDTSERMGGEDSSTTTAASQERQGHT